MLNFYFYTRLVMSLYQRVEYADGTAISDKRSAINVSAINETMQEVR